MSLTNPDRNVTVDDLQYYEQRWVHHNLATIEPTTTASKAYAIGDYLVYSGQLYKVTSPIASGGTIVISGAGANVAETVVVNELLGKKLTSTVSGTSLTFTDSSITSTAVIDGPYIQDVLTGVSAVVQSGTTLTYTLSDNVANNKTAYIWVRG